MIRIGIIGCGKMGSAMLSGMLSGHYKKEQLTIFNRSVDQMHQLKKQYEIQVATSYQDLLSQVDVVMVGVKPQGFLEVLENIKDDFTEDHLLISIAAGISINTIETIMGKPIRLCRVMPNTPAKVQAGMSAIVANEFCSQDDISVVKTICCSFGQCEVVSESMMDAVIAVSGSSPAYVFLFLEALADGAVLAGMPRDMAYRFAAQSVLGSAKLLLETGKHPGVLKDEVCSPGGTTIEAVAVLEEEGFRSSIMKAMNACVLKSKAMTSRDWDK